MGRGFLLEYGVLYGKLVLREARPQHLTSLLNADLGPDLSSFDC